MTIETKKTAQAPRTCVLYIDFLDLLDDHLVALVASRIYWWCCVPSKNGKSKLRAYKNGHWWLVKSHADWEAELKLTRRQVNRVMDVLERHQLVQTMVAMFNGKPTTHIRYVGQIDPEHVLPKQEDGETLQLIAQDCTPRLHQNVQTNAPECADHCTVGCKPLHRSVHSLTCNTTCITTCITNMNSKRVASSTPDKAKDILKSFTGKTENFSCKENLKISPVKIVEEFENLKISPATSGGVLAMKIKWKRLQPDHLGFQKELTAKEMGQLKHVHKALGERAMSVMEWALTHWQDFTSGVQGMKGVSVVPSIPVVGFFCQYYDVAVNLMDAKPQAMQPLTLHSIALKPVVVVDKPIKQVHTPQQSYYLDVMAQLEKLTGKP